MNEKVIAQIPWASVMALIAKLIRYSKGGIDKQEAADLAEDLLLLAAHLIEAKKV
jgi:hypothetical protein